MRNLPSKSSLHKMSDDELQDRIVRVLDALSDVKFKVDSAKAAVIKRGEYSDPDWFISMNSRKRLLGAEHQMLQREASRRKSAISKELTFENAFIDAARELLDQDLFYDILDSARTIAESRRRVVV